MIERLEGLARSAAPTSGATLLGARYEGRIAGEVAHFEVKFSVYCFSDSPTTLVVPLGGVQLRTALLDGVTAFPRLAGAERYAFALRGRGMHSLGLQFEVPTPAGTEREVRFTIPELPINALDIVGPPGAQQLQVLSGRGLQRVTPELDRLRLEVDLGRVGAVHLRWRQPGSEPAARPKVQEFGLWDVSEASVRLLAVYRYQFGASHASSLEYEVPAELEVASATVRALDDRATAGGVVGLRDLLRAPAAPRLRLDFQAPLTGSIQVALELIPRGPLNLRPQLPLPAAVGAGERETLLAVRVRRLGADCGRSDWSGPAGARSLPRPMASTTRRFRRPPTVCSLSECFGRANDGATGIANSGLGGAHPNTFPGWSERAAPSFARSRPGRVILPSVQWNGHFRPRCCWRKSVAAICVRGRARGSACKHGSIVQRTVSAERRWN